MKKIFAYGLSFLMASVLMTSCDKEGDKKKTESVYGDFTEKAFGMELKMVWVEGSAFPMGATPEQGDTVWEDEVVHKVKLDSYWIGKYEITQSQYEAVMGSNPSLRGKGANLPVEYVTWNEARAFCEKLSAETGKKYMLPTEAQWEYAARGGIKSKSYKYSGSDNIEEVAWFSENADAETHDVGLKKANELGIHDMSGNVWEWCMDLYGVYDEDNPVNPGGPAMGSDRVCRGGSWFDIPWNCRVSRRDAAVVDPGCDNLGFRVVVIP